jgi:phosphohistidine phosphatase
MVEEILMRELLLLCHAHAEPASEGQAEAEAAGRWLKDKRLVPDCVLCSPSRRTRETLEAVLSVIGYVDQRLEDGVYEASAGTLAAIVDQHRDVERLMVVGHNPGLERLVALMHSGQSGDYRGMPPGGIAVLRLPADTAIEPGIATLSEFWWP